MKLGAIFFVSCVLFSLLPANFSQEEPSMAPTSEPVWCPSKQLFSGSCTEKGSPRTTCFLDFLSARSASEMPRNCNCTPQPKNMRLCECEVVCDDCCN
ncbi:unnamed protein product [Cochlearia groenlandica]